MLRTEADEIGGGELLITHVLHDKEARRLTPRCRCSSGDRFLSFALLFVLFGFDAMFAPGYFFRLVHIPLPFN